MTNLEELVYLRDYLKKEYPNVFVRIWFRKKVSEFLGLKVVSLDHIVVDEGFRNKGIGTNVLNTIVDWADKNKITLLLSPYDNPEKKYRLIKFYNRFGFEFTDDLVREYSYELMIRKLN